MNFSWINAFYQILNHWGYSHPVHPAVVHMPIGLVVGAFILGWLGFLFKRESLTLSARHCLTLAFVFWFPVVLFGFMDWQHFYGGSWLPPVIIKMALSSVLMILLLAALIFGFKTGGKSRIVLSVYTLGLFTVILLGFFGAQLVYERKTPVAPKTYQVGEKLFALHCITCHPGGGNSIKPNRPIKNSPKLKDLDTFIAWIRHPVYPMPKFPESEISVGQAKELLAYLSEVLTRPTNDNRGS